MFNVKHTITVAAAALALGGVAPAAHAAQVLDVGPGTLFTDPDDGTTEANTATLGAIDGATIRVHDPMVNLIAGQGCKLVIHENRVADCAQAQSDTLVGLDGGTGSDSLAIGLSLQAHFPNVAAILDGGDGNDRLVSIAEAADLRGGNGADIIRPGRGKDLVDGGDGNDLVDYSERSVRVTLNLGSDQPDQGENAEGDTFNDVEWAVTGSGNDIITGSGDPNEIDGRTGADKIRSSGGNDTIMARDNVADDIGCGTGTDTVYADDKDTILGDCETVKKDGGLPLAAAQPAQPAPDPGTLPGEQPAPGTPPAGGTGGPDAGQPTPAPAADTTAPALTKLKATPKTFRPGVGSKRGTRFAFGLSEAGKVEVKLFLVTKGRKVSNSCRKATSKNRGKKRCDRLTPRSAFTSKVLLAGAASVKWSGAVNGKTLKSGTYKVTLTPVDLAGNRGKGVSTRVTVKRK